MCLLRTSCWLNPHSLDALGKHLTFRSSGPPVADGLVILSQRITPADLCYNNVSRLHVISRPPFLVVRYDLLHTYSTSNVSDILQGFAFGVKIKTSRS